MSLYVFVSALWLFVLFQSDLSLLSGLTTFITLTAPPSSVSYMYTHTDAEKHLGQGHRSVGLNGRWSAVTNRQWGCLMMWGGTQRCCTHQLQMADMLHTPFHLLPLLLHEILPNNYTPQLWLWLTTPLQKSLHRWTFVRPCKHKTPQRFQINVPHAEVAVVRH